MDSLRPNLPRSFCVLAALFALSLPLSAQTHFWNSTDSGNWSQATKWTPNEIPNSASHFAAMGVSSATPYSINMDMNVVLDQLQLVAANAMLTVIGRTITVNGWTEIGSGTTLNLHSTTWGPGTIGNNGLIEAIGTSSIAALTQTGELKVLGRSSAGNAHLHLGASSVNSNLIELTSIEAGFSATLTMDGGATLDNSGEFRSLVGAGGPRTFDGRFINRSVARIETPTTFKAGPLELTSNTFLIDTGGSLTLPNGVAVVQNGGDLQTTGPFSMGNGSYDFQLGAVVGKARILSGSLNISSSNGGVGEFEMAGATDFSGDIGLPHKVVVHGDGGGGTATMTAANGVINNGILTQTTAGAGHATSYIQSAGSVLTNRGTLDFLIGAGGTRTFDGEITNEGNGSILHKTNTTFKTGPFFQFGNWTIDPAVELRLANGTTLDVNGGTFDIQGTLLHDSGTDHFRTGDILGTPLLTNSNLLLDASFTTPFDVVVRGSSTLTGDLESGQTLEVRGSGYGGTGTLTLPFATANKGTLRLSTVDAAHAVNLDFTGLALSNQGVMEVLVGAGGARTIKGDYTNVGTFDLQQSTTMQNGFLHNQGTLTVQPGVALTLATTLAFEQQSGILDIQGSISHSSNSDRFLGGTVNGVPVLTSTALELGPAFTTPFEAQVRGTSTLTGDIDSGQRLENLGSGGGGTANLTLNQATTNRGTLAMTTQDAGHAVNLNVNGFNFTNEGVFETLVGTGGPRTVNGSMVNNGTVNLNQPTVFNTGPITNVGDWNLATGQTMTLNSGITFEQSGGTLNLDGTLLHTSGTDNFLDGIVIGTPILRSTSLTFDPVNFSDPATFQIEGTSSLNSDVPAQTDLELFGLGGTGFLTLTTPVNLDGTLTMSTQDAGFQVRLDAVGGNALTIRNLLATTAGAGGTRVLNGDYLNQGTMQLDYPATLNTGPLANEGALNVASGSSLAFGSGVTFEQRSGTLVIDGSFNHSSGTDRFLGGDVSGLVQLLSSAIEFGPAFIDPSTFLLRGTNTFSGAIAAGQEITMRGQAGNQLTTASTGLLNQGIIRLDTADAGFQTKLTVDGGPFQNEGQLETLTGAGGTRILQASVENSGSIDFHHSTTVGTTGSVHLNNGTITNHGVTLTFSGAGSSFTNQANGRVQGTGTISATPTTLDNEGGTWAPGLSAGNLAVTGNWNQGANGTLEIEIGGLIPDTEHDQLSVSGAVNLDGTLDLRGLNGFVPAIGNQFTVLTAASVNGTFAEVTYQGQLPLGYGMDVIYTPTAVIAQVVQTINNIGASATELVLHDPTPGLAGQLNSFQIDGATGLGGVALVWGTAPGASAVTGCPGLDFAIDNAQLGGQAPAGTFGTALIQVQVPGPASGLTVLFQALDVERCLLSAVGTFTFP